jgi:transposase InsO family protein
MKTELVHLRNFVTREDAKTTIVEWIEVFYNRQRIHSTLNASFLALNFAKLESRESQGNAEPVVFSMDSIKRRALNAH